MELKLLANKEYGVYKFASNFSKLQSFLKISDFKSLTYTDEECSIIAPINQLELTEVVSVEEGWVILKIMGTLDFSLTGILSQIANPLAENQISIFALSTYDTDYILVKKTDQLRTCEILTNEGHQFK